ncbi:hypothetical protein [Geopseudomonas aromaticivorans]
MSQALKAAIDRLNNLDTSLKPVQLADQREAALVDGLHALAANYGLAIEFTHIDANGEMKFTTKGGEPYGEELASWLSTIPRRTGLQPTSTPVLPSANWGRLNHFDVERLLKAVGESLEQEYQPDGPAI